MKIAVYSCHPYEKEYLQHANQDHHELHFLKANLDEDTAALAEGADAVALFSTDDASASVLKKLASLQVQYVTLRSTGFNHVDLDAAADLGIKVANVPAYSPHAIAEHAVGLMLALNRKLVKAHRRIQDQNFKLDGLIGFDMNGKTVAVVGTGSIGAVVCKILNGFGCKLLAFDTNPNKTLTNDYGVAYCSLEEICRKADIITLHAPLNEKTHYLIDAPQLDQMKKGVMLINTSRGPLLNTKAIIKALKSKKIGYLGLDVYEEEQGLFYEDHSGQVLQDDQLARLMTFPNVLITAHQAFLTETALQNIADTTIENIEAWASGKDCKNELQTNK
ncbi:MAG: 2-hydroxyacid dehydrogenase [Bacteroidota bacterium]